MPLSLPYVIDAPDVQGNFDAIATAWPNRNVGVFSAYRAAALNLTSPAVVPFDTDNVAGLAYDVSGWFDTTTNVGRFTPQVAGYYRMSWMVGAITPVAPAWVLATLNKNGAIHKRALLATDPSGALGAFSGGTSNVFANGSTDFFEVQFFTSVAGARAISVGFDFCYFTGELIAP
jgi:hypothetical protein